MKEIKNTEKLILFEEITKSVKKIYRQNKDDEKKEKFLIYSFIKGNIDYEYDGEKIKKIIIEDSDEFPSFISQYGYGFSERSLNNFFRYKFNDNKIDTIILSESKTSTRQKSSLVLNYDDIELLLKLIRQEQRACDDTKKTLIKNLIVDIFPDVNFDYSETNNNKDLILRNLNDKLIAKLTANEIQALGEFYVKATQKFKAGHIIKKMTAGLMKNAQILSLQEIIIKYEKLLTENPAESEWQKFFDEYITLFDSRYVHKVNYKNIATGITKYPDLVLVDIYGYIDFYELKKSSTDLIQYDKSHKTWFWSKDVSMVIAQVSDYIQKSKENALPYAKTIKEETETDTEQGLEVNIINPRAIIVIGHTKQLDTEKKRNHFKNLRESLKDIEFVLYDELLERLKNLLASIQTSATLTPDNCPDDLPF
ncbi:Shedu anti-phage system protein SduA domain-containing protein [Flavobacterium sp. ST-87]|uniref:Shedu anti-phage system protein SduA domain-containing protein n=1 Tax=Flavobacterium plantiphilum TaxID=3163297 RepID=A0ABW8XQ17_9FLAO